MTDDGGVIRRLLPRIQPYAWGSHTAMTELLHVASTGGPMAELWLGDHPLLPSNVATTAEEHETLDQILAGDPASWFDSASRQHGTSLSFLLKVMAIAEPLSLQTHPDLAQAQAGFAREDALGIERTAPNRNYRDANHKPELICALTEMMHSVGSAGLRKPWCCCASSMTLPLVFLPPRSPGGSVLL